MWMLSFPPFFQTSWKLAFCYVCHTGYQIIWETMYSWKIYPAHMHVNGPFSMMLVTKITKTIVGSPYILCSIKWTRKINLCIFTHTKKPLISIDKLWCRIFIWHKNILINLNTLWFLFTNKIQFQVMHSAMMYS